MNVNDTTDDSVEVGRLHGSCRLADVSQKLVSSVVMEYGSIAKKE